MNFFEQAQARGLVYDSIPGTAEYLKKGSAVGYLGIDPTADSMHVGHLVGVMVMKHFQMSGNKPLMIVGGATGMIGDPSGKSEERNLLSQEIIEKNVQSLKKQLQKFLDFSQNNENSAEILNNYDWFKDLTYIEFIRDIGKHITVSSMISKDSVKRRLEKGMSFTEFTYQVAQGYDFYHLHETKNCKIQLGGSDQWGNIVAGTEIVRKKTRGEVFGFTFPLMTKSDGGKFGKTESGTVWLDPKKTSPYKFYQFWLNVSDDDAKKYIKVFSIRPIAELEKMIAEHDTDPGLRALQKSLAEELTRVVHSEESLQEAIKASNILFGKTTFEHLDNLSEQNLLEVFEGVPSCEIEKSIINDSPAISDFISTHTQFLKSKGEAKRAIKQNAISVNKNKVQENYNISSNDLIKGKYIILQKGKKDYFFVHVI